MHACVGAWVCGCVGACVGVGVGVGVCVCVTHLNRCKICTFVCGPLVDVILLNNFNLQGARGRIDGTGQRRPIYVAVQTYVHFFHLLSWDG